MRQFVLMAAIGGLACSACGVGAEGESSEGVAQKQDPLYLGSTTDQCSSNLSVLNSAGVYQGITRGHWTPVSVNDRQFRWKCGNTLEQTTCNIGTNWVNVYHSTTSREITWHCQS
jgi:hypothetical protein